MKNTFGNAITMTIFGESHGPYIGVTLDGLAPGIEINDEEIQAELTLRRPQGKISTARQEADPYQIISGVFNGKTTGTALTIIIPNSNTHSSDYSYGLARPGHADFAAYEKYHGFEDYRGGGHFSGRITAAVVAAGAIFRSALKKKNILVGTHISDLGDIKDRDFADLKSDIEYLHTVSFPVLDSEKAAEMKAYIEEVGKNQDSAGGKLQTVILGVPAGLGEPFFDSVESELAHAVFSIPAVKGIGFGAGGGFVHMTGSQANDAMRVDGDKVYTKTNNNGGINGGITNGMPIVFSTVVKATPSIYKKQETINFLTKENADLEIKGRHDPAVIHRARIVVDAMAAFVICDLLTQRFGTDFLAKQENES